MSSLAAVAGVVQGFDEAQAPGQVTILRMEGGTTLAPHCGPRNSRLTAHLPLIVPEIDEPKQGSNVGLRVGHPRDESWQMWEEGQVLIFDDSFEHEARWPEATAEVSTQAFEVARDSAPDAAVQTPIPTVPLIAASHLSLSRGCTQAQETMLGEYDDGEPGGARYILYASLWHPDLGTPTLPEERKWPGALHCFQYSGGDTLLVPDALFFYSAGPELAAKYEDYYAEEQPSTGEASGPGGRKGKGRGKGRGRGKKAKKKLAKNSAAKSEL